MVATGHAWDSGKVTAAPTALNDDIKTYTCKNCKLTKNEKLSATGVTLKKEGNTWYYIKDGKKNPNVTTLVKYGNAWYYVKRE